MITIVRDVPPDPTVLDGDASGGSPAGWILLVVAVVVVAAVVAAVMLVRASRERRGHQAE